MSGESRPGWGVRKVSMWVRCWCIVPYQRKDLYIVLVSRVFWYMELKPGQWRLMIWEVWERTERMMVRWMCGVSLKDRRRSEDLCNLFGINCVADVVRRVRLRWFGYLERKSVDDWVSACRGVVVEGMTENNTSTRHNKNPKTRAS